MASGSPVRNLDGWRTAFALDLRSLALFRITLGICAGADLIRRLALINPFYADWGPVPREAVFRFGDPWTISLHFLGGGWELQTFLVWVGIVCAAGLAAGYRTRLCAVVSWVLLSSLHARDPLILSEGDALLRILLFWSMFLPVNGRLSLDRALNVAPALPLRYVSIASAALTLQICAVYWVAAARQPSPAIGLLEIFGPVLVLASAWTPRLRVALLVATLALHAVLGLTLRLGSLPWVLSAAWLALLPAVFWVWLEPRGPRVARRVAEALRLLEVRLRRFSWAAILLPPPPREPGRTSNLVVAAAAAIIVLSLPEMDAGAEGIPTREPGLASKLASLTQLGQRWTLRSPAPGIEHAWYVFEGVRADGSRLDPWSGGGIPSEAKPADMATWYRNSTWATYLTRLRDPRYAGYRSYLGQYLCLTWNPQRRMTDRVRAVDIDYMAEGTPAPGQPAGAAVREQGWRQLCPEMYPYPLTWWF
jgi:hypothetical protein